MVAHEEMSFTCYGTRMQVGQARLFDARPQTVEPASLSEATIFVPNSAPRSSMVDPEDPLFRAALDRLGILNAHMP